MHYCTHNILPRNIYIYIINFAYITITITSYACHSDHAIRRSSPAIIHYGAVDSIRTFAPSTGRSPNPGPHINHYYTSMPDNVTRRNTNQHLPSSFRLTRCWKSHSRGPQSRQSSTPNPPSIWTRQPLTVTHLSPQRTRTTSGSRWSRLSRTYTKA